MLYERGGIRATACGVTEGKKIGNRAGGEMKFTVQWSTYG
jgi:hypothetical protein